MTYNPKSIRIKPERRDATRTDRAKHRTLERRSAREVKRTLREVRGVQR